MKTLFWKVQYIVQGTVKETLRTNVSMPLAKYIRKQAEESGNYKYGIITIKAQP